jgi:hypothetical protein
MARHAKFVTASAGAVAFFLSVVLTPEDNATAQAIIAAVVGLLTAVGVYAVPNTPTD